MAQLRYADLSVWEDSGVACITPPNTPRLRELIADLDPDDVAFTTDLGYLYIVMNGPVTKSKPDLRVTKSFLARRRFCTKCAPASMTILPVWYGPRALVVVSRRFNTSSPVLCHLGVRAAVRLGRALHLHPAAIHAML